MSSSNWYLFDRDTVEERERDQAAAEIDAAERAALAAIRQISAAARKHPRLVGHAARASLIHLSNMAAVEAKTLGKEL